MEGKKTSFVNEKDFLLKKTPPRALARHHRVQGEQRTLFRKQGPTTSLALIPERERERARARAQTLRRCLVAFSQASARRSRGLSLFLTARAFLLESWGMGLCGGA